MKRRDLIRYLTVGLTGGGLAAARSAAAQTEMPPDEADGEVLPDDYFLDSGELSDAEQETLLEVARLEELQMSGQPTVIPRGLRDRRAPTYRFVHWSGEIGDSQGRFLSPLSVDPDFEQLPAYQINAQILGFHCATDEWRGRNRKGTLTIELRGMVAAEPMTWLFAQQFDLDNRGFSNLGFEYVAQRDGSPVPVVTDELNLGMRIQLLRSPRRGGVALRRFLSLALSITGLGIDLAGSPAAQKMLPPMRIPAMMREGLALSQAVIGGTAEEAPIWRGGFSSYGVAKGGSPLSLKPGYWMAIDTGREIDLRDVLLEDLDGSLVATRDGRVLDANFLILSVEIGEGSVPPHVQLSA